MATLTPNYGLTKPAYDESAYVGVINDNMDILDTALATILPEAELKTDYTLTPVGTGFTLTESSLYKYGPIVFLNVRSTVSAAVQPKGIFAKYTLSKYRPNAASAGFPAMSTASGSVYIMSLGTDGTLTVNVAVAACGNTAACTARFVYLTDD